MTTAHYRELKVAVDVAFAALNSNKHQQAYVIPAEGGWRVCFSLNTAALVSKENIAWAKLWDHISAPGSELERKKRLWSGLLRLSRAQNSIAIKAQHAIELFANKQKWSPGFKEGAQLFVRFSPEHPFFRG